MHWWEKEGETDIKAWLDKNAKESRDVLEKI